MLHLFWPVRTTTTDQPKKISLALQGGGAHGAFTWGVLDYFLEDRRLTVTGISGAFSAKKARTDSMLMGIYDLPETSFGNSESEWMR